MSKIDCSYQHINTGSAPPDGGEMVSILGQVRSTAPEDTEPIRIGSETVLPFCIGCTVYQSQCSGMRWTWSPEGKILEPNNKSGIYVNASSGSEPPRGAPCLKRQNFKL